MPVFLIRKSLHFFLILRGRLPVTHPIDDLTKNNFSIIFKVSGHRCIQHFLCDTNIFQFRFRQKHQLFKIPAFFLYCVKKQTGYQRSKIRYPSTRIQTKQTFSTQVPSIRYIPPSCYSGLLYLQRYSPRLLRRFYFFAHLFIHLFTWTASDE